MARLNPTESSSETRRRRCRERPAHSRNTIAKASPSLDEGTNAGARELGAQRADDDFNDTVGRITQAVVQALEECHPREALATVAQERLQERVLFWGERHRRPGHGCEAGIGVEGQLAIGQYAGGLPI